MKTTFPSFAQKQRLELAAPFLSQEFFFEVEEYFTYPFQLILDKLGSKLGPLILPTGRGTETSFVIKWTHWGF